MRGWGIGQKKDFLTSVPNFLFSFSFFSNTSAVPEKLIKSALLWGLKLEAWGLKLRPEAKAEAWGWGERPLSIANTQYDRSKLLPVSVLLNKKSQIARKKRKKKKKGQNYVSTFWQRTKCIDFWPQCCLVCWTFTQSAKSSKKQQKKQQALMGRLK